MVKHGWLWPARLHKEAVTMNHMEFEKNGRRYSLTGSVITIFLVNGEKLRQLFFHDEKAAREAFFKAK